MDERASPELNPLLSLPFPPDILSLVEATSSLISGKPQNPEVVFKKA
jgi:hypothetical protein